MNDAISYSAAFMIGLVGSPHCVGMCGGIAGLLASSTEPPQAAVKSTASATGEYIPIAERHDRVQIQDQLYQILLISLFQLGRISCYALLGALAGGVVGGLISASSFAIEDLANITKGLRILASLMLVMVALSIAGWTQLTRFLESAGGGVWTRIQPLTKHLIPVNSPRKALAIGGLWGFLPCGLIYSALAWSALSGSALQSAVLMFCFGLGTVPAVMGVGGLTGSLRLLMKKPIARRGFAVLLIALAITPWLTMGEKSHTQHNSHSNTPNQQEHLMHLE